MPSDVDLLRKFVEAIGSKKRILEETTGQGDKKKSMINLLYSEKFEENYFPEDEFSIPKRLDFARFDRKFNLARIDLQKFPTDYNFNGEVLPRFTNLRILNLGLRNNFEKLEKDFFYGVQNLEKLSFERMKIESLVIDLSKNINLKRLNFTKFKKKTLDITFPNNFSLRALYIEDLNNKEFYKLTKDLEGIKHVLYFGNNLQLDKKFFDYLTEKKVFKFSTKINPAKDIMLMEKLDMFDYQYRRHRGKWEFINVDASPFKK